MHKLDCKGKHVFFISDNDKFFYLYADALINKVGIKAEDILAVVYSMEEHNQFEKLKKVPLISYFEYSENISEVLTEAKTLTFMSLHKWNSGIAREIIEYDQTIVNKLYVFLTDDEVSRWNAIYIKNKVLIESDKKHVSENDIYVLSKVIYFIAPKEAFELKLQYLLNRTDICIIDGGLIFDILPTKMSSKLEDALISSSTFVNKNKQILIGTKPRAFSIKEIASVLKACCNESLHKEYTFLLLWPEKNGTRRIILDLYLLFLRYVKKQKVNVNYVGTLSPFTYNVLVVSCSHIILQNRGGFSSARMAIKWQQSIICVAKDSENHDNLENGIKADVITFRSLKELAFKISTTSIDLKGNAVNVKAKEREYVSNLVDIYS